MRTPNAEDFRKQIPACCSVMYTEMQEGDEVMEEPLSGQGASLTIRYRLPR